MTLTDHQYKLLLDTQALLLKLGYIEIGHKLLEIVHEETRDDGDREGEEAWAEHTAPY